MLKKNGFAVLPAAFSASTAGNLESPFLQGQSMISIIKILVIFISYRERRGGPRFSAVGHHSVPLSFSFFPRGSHVGSVCLLRKAADKSRNLRVKNEILSSLQQTAAFRRALFFAERSAFFTCAPHDECVFLFQCLYGDLCSDFYNPCIVTCIR